MLLLVQQMRMQLRLERRRQRAMPIFFLLLQRLVVRVGSRSRVAHSYDGRLILFLIQWRDGRVLTQFAIQNFCLFFFYFNYYVSGGGGWGICWRIGHKETADEQRRLLPELWQQQDRFFGGGHKAQHAHINDGLRF